MCSFFFFFKQFGLVMFLFVCFFWGFFQAVRSVTGSRGLAMGLLPDMQNCGLRMRRECRERFPRHRLHRKSLVSDPDTCVTHVPWCMSGSQTQGGGKTFPAFPAHAQPLISRIWQEVHGMVVKYDKTFMYLGARLFIYSLTHLHLDKMVAISQTIFSDAFFWLKSFVFWLKFHWSLFPRVQLTTTQHWFR